MNPFVPTLVGRLALTAVLSVVATSAVQAQVAGRDTANSPSRVPTAAEAQSLQAASAKKSAPVGLLTGRVNPQPITYADGTVQHELDTSTLVYSVARRNADGSISLYCVEGSHAAQQIVDGKVVASHKGHQHDLK